MVAAFSVTNVLDGSLIFITEGDSTMMALFGSVLGQWGRKPWTPELADEYRRQGAHCSSEQFGPYAIHCVELQVTSIAERPSETSSVILSAILGSVAATPKDRQSWTSSVNGVIGSANVRTAATDPLEFMTALRNRFVGRSKLATVIRHPRFQEFLLAKSYELAEKKRTR
jgi:hypothetical protein